MYEICELIRYGDDERQLALEQLFAKAGVKTCSQAYLLQKAPQADRICILVDSLLPCRQYCFLCHVTKKRCNRHMRRHLQVL